MLAVFLSPSPSLFSVLFFDLGCGLTYCFFFQDVERVMGCTGSPQDSHDIRWYTIHKDKLLRCGECGSGELYISCSAPKVEVNLLPAFFFFSVYKLDYHGPEEGEHGHH